MSSCKFYHDCILAPISVKNKRNEKKNTCYVQLNIVLWDRANLNCKEILKADNRRLQQLWKIIIFSSRHISQIDYKYYRETRELNKLLKVLLNLHNFPLLNINCTEPYLGPLYGSYITVQILKCKIPERLLLTGAICKPAVFKTPVKMCGLSPFASFYFETSTKTALLFLHITCGNV